MKTITEEAFNTQLGQKLMIVRVKERMTLQQVGVYLGVTGQQVHRYETGESRIPPEKIDRYCRIFSVTPTYFFDDLGDVSKVDQALMSMASALYALPDDLRHTFYTLGRQVTTHLQQGQAIQTGQADNDPAPPKDTAA